MIGINTVSAAGLKPSRTLVCLSILMTVLAALTFPVSAEDPKAAAPSHVAVVDYRLAYENLQETIDRQHEVDAIQKELSAMVAPPDPQGLVDKTRSPDEHRAFVDEADRNALAFQNRQQALRAKMVRMQNHQLKRSFDHIRSAVASIAATRGLDLAVAKHGNELPPGIADDSNLEQVGNLLFNRNVMFTGDNVDITADVILAVNKDYKSTAPPQPSQPTTTMRIGAKTYTLEIAGDDASREHGLMERDSIASDHGMIFVFPLAQEQHFWMRHTRFPLDIIYADTHGQVVSIHAMKPYDESSVDSDGLAKYAIELPGGQATATGVRVGQLLSIPAEAQASIKK